MLAASYLCSQMLHAAEADCVRSWRISVLHIQGRVLRSLWAVHWRQLGIAAGCRMLQNLTAWAGPFLLQALLGHLQAPAAFCKSPFEHHVSTKYVALGLSVSI